jgi:uncharacterized membrane protein YGL010W
MGDLTPITAEASPPPKGAPFADKMAYYRSQHTTPGIRATHLAGIPAVTLSMPLILGRPKLGVPMFLGGWALQVIGHKVFEKNQPALTKGFLTYQFCGLAYWCQEMVELISGQSELLGGGTADRREAA